MVKAKQISTLEQAIEAYGSERRFCAAFRMKVKDLAQWRQSGTIPRAHVLGLYLGLTQRGYQPVPKLFGVNSFKDIEGF